MAQCTDCDATIKYQGDSSQRTFSFPFEYSKTTEIKVSVYDPKQLKYVSLDYGTDWRLLNATTVETTEPPKEPIVIYRCTDLNQMEATFHPGHSVKAEDLNDDFNQLKFAIEETRCGIGAINDELLENTSVYLNRIDADGELNGLTGDLVKAKSKLTIDDEHVATTQWIDNRYWDQCEETTYMVDNWVDEIDDGHIPTTGAVESRISAVLGQLSTKVEGAVISVNGQEGVVSLGIGNLTDVETASVGHIPTNGQALVWDAGMNHWMPGTVAVDSGIPEAPEDDKQYARKNATWSEVESTESFPEAPNDGRQYGRQSKGWTEIVSTGGGGGDSGLWQQSGNALEPVDGAEDLVIPGGITAGGSATFTGNVTANGYALAQLPALPA